MLLAAFSLVAFGAVAGQREPAYQGRSLSDWVSELDPHVPVIVGQEPAAWVAIGRIGTNAIPTLLRWMAEDDPPEPPKPDLAPCYNIPRSERAELAFHVLGETARPAIHELTRLALTLPERERYDRCINVLAYIGPASLPSFNTILTKGTSGRRFSAMEWLPAVGTNCVSVLPALVNCLVGKDEGVGWKAASTICELQIPGSAVVPALTNSLRTASAPARARVFRCLFWLNDPAREAVPAIRLGLADRNSEVRTNATYAAERIAPELLAGFHGRGSRRTPE
jgi:hypothetical protein